MIEWEGTKVKAQSDWMSYNVIISAFILNIISCNFAVALVQPLKIFSHNSRKNGRKMCPFGHSLEPCTPIHDITI